MKVTKTSAKILICLFCIGTLFIYRKEFRHILSDFTPVQYGRFFFTNRSQKGNGIDAKTGRNCVPQSNIVFLKTHKTASSTVQNMLLRYSNKNNLTVGLSDAYDFKYGRSFREEFVATPTRPINIICHHMVFNYFELQKVMPKGTTYVTTLREPSSQFESTYEYYYYDNPSFSRVEKRQNSMEYWLNNTEKLFRGKNDGHFWWFAKNLIFFDLGYDNLSEDDQYIKQAIMELENTFDLVMLSDYFDESMLLLKDLLCWSMEDILSIKSNARNSSNNNLLNNRVRKKIYEWNKADAAVYQHFNRTFWKKVEAYGYDRMKNDLQVLEKMNAQLKEYCIEGDSVSNKYIKDSSNKMYNPRGVVMTGYNLKKTAKNNVTCANLVKGELQWTSELLKKIKI